LEDEPELLPEITHIWDWFLELTATRGSNGFGVNPITYTEIDAWSRLLKTEPSPLEIELIKIIDSVYLEKVAKDSESETKKSA